MTIHEPIHVAVNASSYLVNESTGRKLGGSLVSARLRAKMSDSQDMIEKCLNCQYSQCFNCLGEIDKKAYKAVLRNA